MSDWVHAVGSLHIKACGYKGKTGEEVLKAFCKGYGEVCAGLQVVVNPSSECTGSLYSEGQYEKFYEDACITLFGNFTGSTLQVRESFTTFIRVIRRRGFKIDIGTVLVSDSGTNYTATILDNNLKEKFEYDYEL